MTARLEGHPEVEPVVWVNMNNHRRVFYTSLWCPGGFQAPGIPAAVVERIFWALDRPVPEKAPVKASPGLKQNEDSIDLQNLFPGRRGFCNWKHDLGLG